MEESTIAVEDFIMIVLDLIIAVEVPMTVEGSVVEMEVPVGEMELCAAMEELSVAVQEVSVAVEVLAVTVEEVPGAVAVRAVAEKELFVVERVMFDAVEELIAEEPTRYAETSRRDVKPTIGNFVANVELYPCMYAEPPYYPRSPQEFRSYREPTRPTTKYRTC